MGYIQGEGRNQATLFPVILDDFVPADHICRVIDAFVEKLAMSELGFERAQAAETGRPGYDPRDLLKLYLYGYLNQIRSSRRLEAECRRNVELMWLLERLYPDHKASLSSVECTATQSRQQARNLSALRRVAV
jgi:transposase